MMRLCLMDRGSGVSNKSAVFVLLFCLLCSAPLANAGLFDRLFGGGGSSQQSDTTPVEESSGADSAGTSTDGSSSESSSSDTASSDGGGEELATETAAAVKPAPVGMFHSGPPSLSGRPAVINSSVNTLSHVTGSLIRVAWQDIHLGDGEFDFAILENEFQAAQQYGDKISLVIYDGAEIPDFVKSECDTFAFFFRGSPQTTCLPWDARYQYYKHQLLQAVGSRYDNNANLAAVYFTYAAMTNGAEMHWRVDEQDFTAAGYTPERLVAAYNAVMDMYAEAFAVTPVVMEVHAVFRSANLAEQGYAHCADLLGERCGVAMWWCAQRMTTNGEEDVWPVVQAASQASFSVCQTIGNFTNQSYRFDEGQGWTAEEAIDNEMSFFRLAGITTWELWSADITNEDLFEVIQRIKDSLPAQ